MIEKLCIWWLNLRWYHATWGEKHWKWSVIFRLLTTFTMAAMSSPLCSLVGQLPFPFRRRRPPNDSAACYLDASLVWKEFRTFSSQFSLSRFSLFSTSMCLNNFAVCTYSLSAMCRQRPCYGFVLYDLLNYAVVISSCVWSKLGLPSPVWGYVRWVELIQSTYLASNKGDLFDYCYMFAISIISFSIIKSCGDFVNFYQVWV